jgi:uncharacterized protein with PQ loop repeat
MKYLKNYQQHNESISKTIAGLSLASSLIGGTPDVKAQNPQNLVPTIQTTNQDGVIVAKNNVEELYKLRKTFDKSKDEKLNKILDNIKQNCDSIDPQKLTQSFNQLKEHIESTYGYKFESQNVEAEFTEANVGGQISGLSIFEILGWLGSICLAICGLPQAWQSYKDKHSGGISWGFILLWTFGEIFALAYVYDKLDLPLVMNYATNILILGVILYYKIYPKPGSDTGQVRSFH